MKVRIVVILGLGVVAASTLALTLAQAPQISVWIANGPNKC
jgi:hypothetical protein